MFQGHLSRLSPKQVIHGRFGKDRQAQKKARAPECECYVAIRLCT